MSALGFEHVSHDYGGKGVLEDVSFELEREEIICLLGPSGCGKTSLLRLAAGLEVLQRGRVIIDGKTVADAKTGLWVPPEKRHVGLCFQDFALFPHLGIIDNIMFGVTRNHAARKQWARDMLGRLGLGGRENAYPHMLSGGEQQRVALLRALAPGPRVILLDEPFSSLDANLRVQMREETLSLIKSSHIAAMMVTHDAEEAMFMADRILVINDGHIVQAGTPEQIYTLPQTPFVASMFGAINRLDAVIKDGMAQTSLGAFPAPGHAEGAHVDVLIRPEGLSIVTESDAGGGQCTAQIVSAHFLGGSSHLHLRRSGDEELLHIDCQARVPGSFLPPPGAKISFKVDEAHVHVFSTDEDGAIRP